MDTHNNQKQENFESLYNKYNAKIAHYIYRYFSKNDFSDDVAQDLFLKMLEKQFSLYLDSEETLPYLKTMAKNIAYDYIRRKRAEEIKLKELQIEEMNCDRHFYKQLDELYIEGEVISTVHDTINSFPEEEQTVIEERLFKDSKPGMVKEKTNISRHKIHKIENELKHELEKKLKQYYH